jgi:hypothetical protein
VPPFVEDEVEAVDSSPVQSKVVRIVNPRILRASICLRRSRVRFSCSDRASEPARPQPRGFPEGCRKALLPDVILGGHASRPDSRGGLVRLYSST